MGTMLIVIPMDTVSTLARFNGGSVIAKTTSKRNDMFPYVKVYSKFKIGATFQKWFYYN